MLNRMERISTTGRIALGLAVVIAATIAAFAAAVAPSLVQLWRAADYPGSIRLSDHTNLNLLHLSFRRDTSYRTKDEFPIVYNWYSSGQNLGPEERAQSNCILMERTFTVLHVIERYMGVMLCDTPNGRMIFVNRTFSWRTR